MQNSLKKLVDEHEIISFDIFDTLLLRPYVSPADLFLHIENHYKISGFAKNRIFAENTARGKISQGTEDVTLDEIYSNLTEEFQKFKDIECEWEIKLLFQNPEIYEIYNYALQKGKKVIFVSDMYLPFEVIEKALHKNNYGRYHSLYLSSQVKKMKVTRNLYNFVIEDLNVNPEKVLHIGDNFFSDFKQANSCGIKGFYYPSFKKRFFEKDTRMEKLYNSISDVSIKIDISILIMMSAVYQVKNPQNDFWANAGYKYAGSMVYSFAKWIETEALKSGIKNIGFVARDGYFLDKVLKILNPEINSQYIYASRNVSEALSRNENSIKLYLKDLETKGLLGNKETAFSDVRTNSFTSQKFLSRYSPNSFWFYWMIGLNRNQPNYKAFYDYDFEFDKDFIISEVVEFFMSAPELPLVSLKENNNELQLVYMVNPSEHEIYRIKVLQKMEPEVLNFAKDIKSVFGEIPILQNPHSIILWNNLWLLTPTAEENEEFGKIHHSSSKNHDKYIPIYELKNQKLYKGYVEALKHFAKKV